MHSGNLAELVWRQAGRLSSSSQGFPACTLMYTHVHTHKHMHTKLSTPAVNNFAVNKICDMLYTIINGCIVTLGTFLTTLRVIVTSVHVDIHVHVHMVWWECMYAAM